MNTAYILAIIWGLLALLALLFVTGKNTQIAVPLLIASVIAGVLGVAIEYELLT